MVYGSLSLNVDGTDLGVWGIGDYTFVCVLWIVTLRLQLSQSQVTWPQQGSMIFFTAIWWPLAFLGTQGFLVSPGLNSFIYGYTGQFEANQDRAAYWLLQFFITVCAILPQILANAWRHRFYPNFRDLVMEANYVGKGKPELQNYRIPAAERRMELRKDAPRPLYPEPRCQTGVLGKICTCWRKCCSLFKSR